MAAKALQKIFSVQGKVALITGASSGLGRHFATTLALQGAKVGVAARRQEKLQELLDDLQKQGVQSSDMCAVKMDVSDLASVKSAVSEVEKQLGPITILINNAGIAVDKPALRQTEEEWHRVMSTNLDGPWFVAQTVARSMVRHEVAGSIINIASVAGIGPSSYMPGYAASKAGLVHLTKCLGLEWAKHQIRVNAIAPGYIVTDMNREFFSTPRGDKVVAKIPQGRVGQPTELDGALLLLASNAGSFMTGTIMNVDGGHLVSNL